VTLTPELVREAMFSVSVQDARDWVAQNVGRSTLSKVSAVSAIVNQSTDSLGATLALGRPGHARVVHRRVTAQTPDEGHSLVQVGQQLPA
jgi:hypothetical protein